MHSFFTHRRPGSHRALPRPAALGLVGSLVLGAGALLGACSVDLAVTGQEGVNENQCSSGDECRVGRCFEGICQATSTDLTSLLLEVAVPSNIPKIGGLNFTQVVEGLEPSGYTLNLEAAGLLTIYVEGGPFDSCVTDESVPGPVFAQTDFVPSRVTFIPRDRLLGLSSPPISVEVNGKLISEDDSHMSVPPGSYDIYVEPLYTDDGCVRPPFLRTNYQVESKKLTLTMEAPDPEKLDVTVRFPNASADLSDWTLAVVDRDTERRLSNEPKLGDGTISGEEVEYSATLAFSQIDGGSEGEAPELIRLQPPEGVVAPTYYVERSIADLFNSEEGLIDQLTDLPEPIEYSSRIAQSNTLDPAPAIVTFVATSLESVDPGTVAKFSQAVETDADGSFDVDLLPGNYRVRVEPLGNTHAATEVEITLRDSADAQAGKTIEVFPRLDLEGNVLSFNGARVEGVAVVATDAGTEDVWSVLDTAEGNLSWPATAFDDTTATDGHFRLVAEPGSYHVSIRPEPSSNFAWQIRPSLEVESSVDLESVSLPLPLVVRGSIVSNDLTADGRLVPGALIRAYAFFNEEGLALSEEDATWLIPVAEARADEDGKFRLLLPSSFK